VTNQGLKSLGQGLYRLTFQSLKINFGWCRDVTDEGLNVLGESLRRLGSLRSLDLKFWQCEKMTDQGLKNRGEGLQSLSSLQSINLEFLAEIIFFSVYNLQIIDVRALQIKASAISVSAFRQSNLYNLLI